MKKNHQLLFHALGMLTLGACDYVPPEEDDGNVRRDGGDVRGDDENDAAETSFKEVPFLNEADYRQFLDETAKESPDASIFEFVGYVRARESYLPWVHSQEPVYSVKELLQAKGIAEERPEVGDDVGRGLLLSADGRLFVEREEVVTARRAKLAGREEPQVSQPSDEMRGVDSPPPTNIHPPSVDDTDFRDTIHGSDGRSLTTATDYPERAVGLALLRGEAIGSLNRGAGSATYIGPRHVLTVAHAIADDNGNLKPPLHVAPLVRGQRWVGGPELQQCEWDASAKAPYGVRPVQWYYWPSQFDGGIAYDYGLLILSDTCNVLPGWIQFGHQTCTWLDYRGGMFMEGSPSPSKTCADDWWGDGLCDGFVYFQYEQTNSCVGDYLYSNFDVQEGQSGAGVVYDIDGSNKTVYGVHKGSEGAYTYAKRLQSGSYSTLCGWLQNWTSQYASNPSC